MFYIISRAFKIYQAGESTMKWNSFSLVSRCTFLKVYRYSTPRASRSIDFENLCKQALTIKFSNAEVLRRKCTHKAQYGNLVH